MRQNSLLHCCKQLVRFALPLSGASFINLMPNFIAMLMVAKLGQIELAAGALAVSTYFAVITFAGASLSAVSILIGHGRGAQQSAQAVGDIFKGGVWLAYLLGIPAMLVLWNASHLLTLFGQKQALVQITVSYFHFAALAMLVGMFSAVVYRFYIGIGRPKFALMTAVIRLPLVVGLSYVFIFGKMGMPMLGLAGVMCAFLIVQTLYSVALIVYLLSEKSLKKYALFSRLWVPNWTLIKKIAAIGVPVGIQFSAELAVMTVAVYLMGLFGVAALAASQIVSQYVLLVIMVVLGLSQAVSVLVSEAFGRRDNALIKTYIKASIMVLVVLFVVVGVIFLCFPQHLIAWFMSMHHGAHTDLVHLATYFFMIAGVLLFVDGVRNVLSSALRGLHDSRVPMQIGVICLGLISLPLSYVIGFTFHGGPIGLRLGFSVGFVIAVIWLIPRLMKKLKVSVSPSLEVGQ